MNVKGLLNQHLPGSHTSRGTEDENICIVLSSQRTSHPVLMAVGRGWALQLPPPISGSRGQEHPQHLSSPEAPVGTVPQVPLQAWHAAALPGFAPAVLVMAACTPSALSSLFDLDRSRVSVLRCHSHHPYCVHGLHTPMRASSHAHVHKRWKCGVLAVSMPEVV